MFGISNSNKAFFFAGIFAGTGSGVIGNFFVSAFYLWRSSPGNYINLLNFLLIAIGLVVFLAFLYRMMLKYLDDVRSPLVVSSGLITNSTFNITEEYEARLEELDRRFQDIQKIQMKKNVFQKSG